MSKRIVLLSAAALALLVAGLSLLGGVGRQAAPARSDPASPPVAGRSSDSHSPTAPPPPTTTAVPTVPPSAAPTPEGAVTWQEADLSKRSFVQREDDSLPRSKDAPPPVFKKESLAAIRAAANPGVEKCKTDIWKRYPELATNPEISASISVVYTATSQAGLLTISTAHVVVNGFPDDNYAKCVQDVFEKLQVQSPPGQAEGKGQVSSSFVGKD